MKSELHFRRSLGCVVNGVNPSSPSQVWEEEIGVLLDGYELEPCSVASYDVPPTDLRGRTILGELRNSDGNIWQPQITNVPASQTDVAVPSGFER